MATEAFASPNLVIMSERLHWFYERCFSLGTTVIVLRDGERKAGQIAMVRQTLCVDGQEESAAQLVDLFISKVDLFISKEFRGKERLRLLYDEVEKQFIKQNIRFAIGMPNAKAVGINEYFFNLKPFLRLPFSMGTTIPVLLRQNFQSFRFDPSNRDQALTLFFGSRSVPEENGVIWDEAKLFERLCSYKREYGIQVCDDILLISSPRSSRGLDCTLLCGFMRRGNVKAGPAAVLRVVRAACRLWGRPLFVYSGVNSKLASTSGIVMSAMVRLFSLLVQLRDFKPERKPLRLDRFQLLDFDFA